MPVQKVVNALFAEEINSLRFDFSERVECSFIRIDIHIDKGAIVLAALSLKLAKEWHPTKNIDLKSCDVKSKSNKKVWWQCDKGHEWQSTVANRSSGKDCPYCSGLRVIKGETDLATVNPNIAKQWHPINNGDLKPEDVKPGSDKKVWWICAKNHEWVASISSRNKRGCPYCSGKRVIKGETDLATVNPLLAKEWHPTMNGTLKAQDVTSKSHMKVWWKCKEGHEWQRTVHGRANNSGCPYCFGRLAVKGKTDLATVNPLLTQEWHPEKNGTLKPDNVTIGSHKKVWWKCQKGHEWESAIYSRSKSGCPFCSGKRVLKGKTDLATIDPVLASEWHFVKNGELKPDAVTAKSNKKVWWKCKENHEWRAVINDRAHGSGCPICRKNSSG